MKRLILMLGVGMALMASSAYAETDALIEGAKRCTAYLPRYEREYGIPTHLLSAIATTETGRYHEGLKIRIPWPWTVNANGKGYIFDTKAEAIAAVRRFRAHGIQSIDVGCMQVNIYHHPEAFASLDQAFDPQANVAYAASFLRSLYNTEGSWKKAAADYHSKTPYLGRQYVSEVYNSWYQIIEKLRAAKLAVPASSVTAMNELKHYARPAATKIHKVAEKDTQLAVYHPLHMKMIRVGKQDNGNTGLNSNIVIMTPDIKVVSDENPPVSASQATPVITVAPAQQVPLTLQPASSSAPDAQIFRASSQTVIETSVMGGQKTGPNFIFND